jgi:aspartate carbamoyltransferase catalytic subunit
MAYGLARLGAKVTLASTSQYRLPDEVRNKLASVQGDVTEVLDSDQTSFNQLISDMHLVYLPGCSAPKGAEADAFKKMMDDYFVRYETLEDVREKEGRTIYVTHTLPRRAGEMDLRIDTTPSQLYFEAIAFSVALRMALVLAISGL